MKVIVGTQNKGKIQSVVDALHNYPEYKGCNVVGRDVETGVNDQPIGLDETITGAKNRARLAYESQESDLGVGLESGIFKVPHTKSKYMDTTACAIFDGQEYHIGLSSCFEYPKVMVDKVLNEEKEITDIALELGFAEDRAFREGQGMIGTLTKGVITRVKFSEQAVHTALVHLLNQKHY
ncbi:MAG: inosine/xanthosine triphosphatase [Patescibacteria group bacterium]